MFFRSFFTTIAVASLLLQALCANTFPDGLYATFDTTEGVFTVELDFDKVPMTVANFVGLAEGSRPWVNFKTGKVSNEPFYDGLKFPRIAPGFVIQAGSPNNTQTGGPGYQFSDEFHPMLNHNTVGTLSMANSGADTNGSQFFITIGPASHLNNRHSVFGRVIQGMSVVNAIGLTNNLDVTINSITIVRCGAAALAFDATAWALPVPQNIEKEFIDVGPVFPPPVLEMRFPRTDFTEYLVFDSPNLSNWAILLSIVNLDSAPQVDLDVTASSVGQDRHFYSVSGTRYVAVPAAIKDKTINMTLTSVSQTLSLAITGDPRSSIDYAIPLGTYMIDTVPPSGGTSGGIGAYLWFQDLRRGRLIVALENQGIFYFNYKFREDGTGTFTANTSSNFDGPFPIFGNYTISDTP